jgi:Domain of unknown function (DUF6438)
MLSAPSCPGVKGRRWTAAAPPPLTVVAALALAATAAIAAAALGQPGGPAKPVTVPATAAHRAPISDAELAAARVELSRTVCYGECPEYDVTLSGSGEVSYVGKEFVKVKGTEHALVDRETVRRLLAAFEQAKFFELPGGECPCAAYTDMPSAISTLTFRGHSRTLNHYQGCTCAPAVLFELEHQIDQAAETDRWVGSRGGASASSGPLTPP